MTNRHAEFDFVNTEQTEEDKKVDHKAILAAIEKKNLPVEEITITLLPHGFNSN